MGRLDYNTSSDYERRIAVHVCCKYVEDIIRDAGGATLGGNTLADKLTERFKAEEFDGPSLWVAADAVRHWVVCAGFTEDDEFIYELSGHRLNA